MQKVMLGLALMVLAVMTLDAGADEGERTASGRKDHQDSFLVTMHRSDPLTRAISLRTGEAGSVFTEDGMANFQSDIDFGHYNDDAFTVGIEGGRIGAIIDLGSQDDLQKRYRHQETVGKGQGFAGLRLVDGSIVGRHGGPIREAEALMTRSKRGSSASAPVHLDHIYLVRITDTHDETFDRIVKLIVVGHEPNERATIRWVVLRDVGARS